MPETSFPLRDEEIEHNWASGSENGGLYGLKRVSPEDKIRVEDLNQLRAYAEALSRHHHNYKDKKGC